MKTMAQTIAIKALKAYLMDKVIAFLPILGIMFHSQYGSPEERKTPFIIAFLIPCRFVSLVVVDM